MTTWQVLTTAWHWEPSVVAGCLILAGGYLAIARPLTARAWSFLAGVVVLLFSLVSPLDVLGDTYLFSAHMIQHLLQTLVVPPLVLLGLPPYLARQVLAWAPARRVEAAVARPLVAWTLATSALWLWHLPAFYDAALGDELLHIVQHLTFLTTATIFWWLVVAPAGSASRWPLPAWATMAYLFTAFLASSLLGALLTFAPPGLYPAYQQPPDRLGLLPLVRDGWGLTPADDQQLGGVLMWVPGGGVYLVALIGVFARWFNQPDDASDLVAVATPTVSQVDGAPPVQS